MESNTSAMNSPEAQPAPVTYPKIGKFKASGMIVRQSWNVLSKDKEILWLPVLSGIFNLIVLALFGYVLYFQVLGGDIENIKQFEESGPSLDIAFYAGLLLYYIITYFIVNFFQATLFKIAYARFQGNDLTLSQGLSAAREHSGRLFGWSLISATVGLILQIISDKSELVGKIVASLLGSAWNILTYFSLPSLVIGNKGIKESFKDSASTIRKTWGEAIIVNFGIGLYMFFAVMILLALGVGLIIAFPAAIIAIVVILALAFITLAIISSSLSAIFKLALYEYAQTGVVPGGFSPEIITHAISAKKK